MLPLPQTKQDIIKTVAVVINQFASLIIARTIINRHHAKMGTQYQPISPIPKPDAPASEVREFFYRTLIEDFNVPPGEAETIASQWRYGGGRELAYFDGEAFRSIFGGEVGTILYEKSRTRSRSTKSENEATFFGLKPIEYFVLMLLGAALLVAIYSMVQVSAGAKEAAASSWRGAGVCFFVAVFGSLMYHIATNLD